MADRSAFNRSLAELRRIDWVVFAKRPFAGPEQVLAYLGRYTHRVAIANSRLVTLAGDEVNFRWRSGQSDGDAAPIFGDQNSPRISRLEVDLRGS